MIGRNFSIYIELDCMARLTVFAVAILATWGAWAGLVYLTRNAGMVALRELTFWISPLAVTGWILALALLILFYKLFGSIWRSLIANHGS
jgi:hypothetical protein